MQAITDLRELLACMQPERIAGCYAFVVLPEGVSLEPATIFASIREPEGLSVIVAEEVALALSLPIAFRAAWITLQVHSDLAAVGLTAAVAAALAEAGISCNVVAGVHHDHLFVPFDAAQQAMDALQALSRDGAYPSAKQFPKSHA